MNLLKLFSPRKKINRNKETETEGAKGSEAPRIGPKQGEIKKDYQNFLKAELKKSYSTSAFDFSSIFNNEGFGSIHINWKIKWLVELLELSVDSQAIVYWLVQNNPTSLVSVLINPKLKDRLVHITSIVTSNGSEKIINLKENCIMGILDSSTDITRKKILKDLLKCIIILYPKSVSSPDIQRINQFQDITEEYTYTEEEKETRSHMSYGMDDNTGLNGDYEYEEIVTRVHQATRVIIEYGELREIVNRLRPIGIHNV
jgi:hypothetical protein